MSELTYKNNQSARSARSTVAIVLSVAIISVVVGCVIVAKSCMDEMGGIAGAFLPQVTVRDAIVYAVRGLDPKFELKVGEREVDAIVERTRETTWVGIPVGTTVTRVKVMGNRVQYIVPLEAVSKEESWEFVGTEQGGALLVHLPAPVVDSNMVSVQTDPKRIEAEVDDQWLANVFVWQGDGVDEAKHAIREKVVEQASASAFVREVQSEAAPKIEALLQAALQNSLRSGVQVKVVWEH